MDQILVSGLERMIQAIELGPDPILLISGSEWAERLPIPPQPTVWQCEKHAYYELAYVDKGACSITLDNSAYKVRTGGLCVVTPGQDHYEAPIEPSSDYTIYWLHADASKLKIHASEYSASNNKLRHLIVGVDAWLGSDISALFQRIIEENQSRRAFSDTIIRGYLLSLIGLACRQVKEIAEESTLPDQALGDPMVRSVCQFIQDHLADPEITVTDIANHVALSPNYLSVCFRKQTGSSPYHFLLQTRIRKARELLITTNRSVAKIAEEVGFVSPYHFSATFKRLSGSSPTIFRSEGRKLAPVINVQVS